jgi:uncharacterized repeat protein (TIGR01451 family)
MKKRNSWVVFSICVLLVLGLRFDRLESGTSSSITLSTSTWTPIGPAPINGPFAGRIDVAAPDPSDPNVMYLGANNGGIWKTTNWLDSSPTWTEITDKPQILSLAIHEHDLVVFPGNPNIVLAAASGPGGGVLRSDDAGNSWSFLGNSRFDLAEFGALVFDPNVANAQTLYVAISGGSANFFLGSGLYKSVDGGATWSAAGLGTFSGLVSDLLAIQENGQTVLYAADTGNGQPNSGGIYRSDDSGATWTSTNFPTKAAGYGSIRLAGSTAPTEKIYASAIDASAGDGGLDYRFVTTNQGGNWSPLATVDAPAPGARHRSHHNVIAVDPANSSHVVVNTDIENNLITRPGGEWIFNSTDSGQTWTAAVDPGGDPVSGSFDGTGVFVVTSDGGIHRDPVNVTDNRGGNLNTIEFYSFSLDPNNTRRGYGLFQDGPGVLKYVGNVDWQYFQPPNAGEAGKIRVGLDPTTNSPRVYFLEPNTQQPVNSPNDSSRFVHSDDGGQTWQPAISGLPTIQVTINGNPATITDYASFPGKGSIVIDPNSPKRLIIGLATFFDNVNNILTPGSVFETTTGGDPNNADPKFNGNGWRDIGSAMANNNATFSAIAITPSDPNTIFAGTEDGRVFKTTNAGNDCNPNCPTWTEVDTGLSGQRIMDLEIDPANPDHDFAVTSDFLGRDGAAPDYSGVFHVWMRNGGAWSQINGNLPTKLGGETLAVDWSPATPVLYIGTLRGGYTSTNLGTTWTRMDSLPRTRVTDLDFMPNLYLLGAGTMGWGAWEIFTCGADLAVSKSSAPASTVDAGTNVTYTIELINNGPCGAGNVTLSDTVPEGSAFVSLSASAFGWSCSTPSIGSSGPITCTKDSMAEGEAVTFTLVTNVPCDVASGTNLDNTATASAATPPDDNSANDSASISLTVNNPVPVVTASVATTLLPQNNHDLVNVGLSASASDGPCPTPPLVVEVFGDEDDQTLTAPRELFSPDAKDIAPGTLRLRQERVSSADGRVYLIVVKATDEAGGTGFATATVAVPKSNSNADLASVNAQAAAAKSYADTHNGAPPAGYFVVGDGPVVGPKQ